MQVTPSYVTPMVIQPFLFYIRSTLFVKEDSVEKGPFLQQGNLDAILPYIQYSSPSSRNKKTIYKVYSLARGSGFIRKTINNNYNFRSSTTFMKTNTTTFKLYLICITCAITIVCHSSTLKHQLRS